MSTGTEMSPLGATSPPTAAPLSGSGGPPAAASASPYRPAASATPLDVDVAPAAAAMAPHTATVGDATEEAYDAYDHAPLHNLHADAPSAGATHGGGVMLHGSPTPSNPPPDAADSCRATSALQHEYVYDDDEADVASRSGVYPYQAAGAAAAAAAPHPSSSYADTHVTYGAHASPLGAVQLHLSSADRSYIDPYGNQIRERVVTMPTSPLYGTDARVAQSQHQYDMQAHAEGHSQSAMRDEEMAHVGSDPASRTRRADHPTVDVETGDAAQQIYVHPSLASARGPGHGAGTSLAAPHLPTLGEAVPKAIFSPMPTQHTGATPRIPHPLKTQPSGDGALTYPYGYWLTCGLLLSYLALFIAEFGTDGWAMESWFVNPTGGPSYATLDRLGAKNTFKILAKRHMNYGAGIDRISEGWRLIAAVFWHAGIVSFIPSMVALAWLGRNMEREYGPLRLGIVWFASAIFGTIFSAIMSVDLLTVTGSAGVFGLIGARAVDLWLYRRWYTRNWLTGAILLLVATIGMVLGVMPLIDNWAHLGAAFMGALGAGILFTGGWRSAPEASLTLTPHSRQRRAELEHTPRYTKTRVTCLVLALLCWALVLGLLFGAVAQGMSTKADNVNRVWITSVWCPECNQLQCMEAPAWTCRPERFYR